MSPGLSWSPHPAPPRADPASAPGHSQVIHWPCKFGNGFGSTFHPGRSTAWLSWLVPAAEAAAVLFPRSTSWRAGIYSCGSVRAAEDERGFPAASVSGAGLPPPANLSPSAGLKFHSGERIRLNSKWAVLSFYSVSFPFNDLKNANNALKSKHCFMSWKCPFPFIYLL